LQKTTIKDLINKINPTLIKLKQSYIFYLYIIKGLDGLMKVLMFHVKHYSVIRADHM